MMLEDAGMVFGEAGMVPSYERTMTYLTRTKTIPYTDHDIPNRDARVLLGAKTIPNTDMSHPFRDDDHP